MNKTYGASLLGVLFWFVAFGQMPSASGAPGAQRLWQDVSRELSCNTFAAGSVEALACGRAQAVFCKEEAGSQVKLDCRSKAVADPYPKGQINTQSELQNVFAKGRDQLKISQTRAAQCCNPAQSAICEQEVKKVFPDLGVRVGAATSAGTAAGGLNQKQNTAVEGNQAVRDVNTAIAGACMSRTQMCSFVAEKLAEFLGEKKKAVSQGCLECDASLDFEIERLKGEAETCRKQSNDVALQDARTLEQDRQVSQEGANQTRDGGEGQQAGAGGGMDAGMMQSLMGMAQQLMQQQEEEDPPMENIDCASNPAIVGCQQAKTTSASSSWNKPGGMQTQSTGSSSQGSFNTADSLPSTGGGLNNMGPGAAQPVTVSPIQGGGGGGLGVMGGGAPPPVAGGQQGAANANIASNRGDILKGEKGGGGYSQTNAGMKMEPGSTGGFSGYGGNGDIQANMDLKDYLPGGAKDPNRLPANIVGRDPMLQPKEVNLFQRISEVIRRRCSQGLLYDCVP